MWRSLLLLWGCQFSNVNVTTQNNSLVNDIRRMVLQLPYESINQSAKLDHPAWNRFTHTLCFDIRPLQPKLEGAVPCTPAMEFLKVGTCQLSLAENARFRELYDLLVLLATSSAEIGRVKESKDAH
ncbi:hypothetical protein GGX14DRAFT_388430 [Mycena pura]|uniref:Uncharacterized protein n=1 Tax=Mycena pura TaxID=153505 RepID=A0AAD6VT44_9AGAR|nr:hypothetical protein GGX14DRAFT_388430 [Mycena pura]